MLSLLTGLLPMQDDPVAALGGQVNLLWVVIGAILVIFMQAGFALVETGFCRAKHAAHVVSTNFAIFGLGFIGFFFVGFPLAFGALDMSSYFVDRPRRSRSVSPLLGSGNWVFLWQGGWALSRRRHHAGAARPLPLHGRLHGHRRHDPDRGRWPSGGSGAASSSGASSAAPSTTRCSRRGPGAAAGSPRRGTR